MPWAAVEERLPPPSTEGTEFEDARCVLAPNPAISSTLPPRL
jgi:hypothetical protein